MVVRFSRSFSLRPPGVYVPVDSTSDMGRRKPSKEASDNKSGSHVTPPDLSKNLNANPPLFSFFGSVEIFLLSRRSGNCDGDTLSPPEGEAAQGVSHPDPYFRLDFSTKLPGVPSTAMLHGASPNRCLHRFCDADLRRRSLLAASARGPIAVQYDPLRFSTELVFY